MSLLIRYGGVRKLKIVRGQGAWSVIAVPLFPTLIFAIFDNLTVTLTDHSQNKWLFL